MSSVRNWSPLDLQPLFAPRSIAIIGASEKTGKRGREVLDNLYRVGFRGAIYPVNPHYERISGLRCYPSVIDIPAEVEAAAIALPAEAAVAAVQECARKGVRAAVVVAAGFAESGSCGDRAESLYNGAGANVTHPGAALEAALAACARESGILLGGPNCLGVWSLPDHCAYWVSSPRQDSASQLAAVLQSGALVSSLADPAAERGLVFAMLATVGNESVLTAGDYLAYLVERPHIRAVAVVIEGVRRPQVFLHALRRAAALGKPVTVLKLGRSLAGRKAALAHTASLAGEQAVVEAVLRQYGALLVHDLDELLEVLGLLEAGRLPKGERFAAVTVSGAGAGLVADLAGDAGLSLASLSKESQAALAGLLPGQAIGNPLDVARAGDEAGLYRHCFAILARDPGIDLLAMAQNTPWGRSPDATAFYVDHAAAAVAAASSTDKLVFAFSLTSGALDPEVAATLRAGHVPLLQGARESLRAASLLIRYANWRRSLLAQEETTASIVNDKRLSSERWTRARALLHQALQGVGENGVLSYQATSELLSMYGIPLARGVLVRSAKEAAEVVASWRRPVALKVLSPQIPHKTEHGLIALDIDSPGQAEAVARRLLAQARGLAGEAATEIEGLLVQEMATGGPELIAGLARDEQFGLLVVLGWGGMLVEAQRAFTLRLPPITLEHAHEMITELPYQETLHGYRGLPALDIAALASLLLKLADLAQELEEEIEHIDLNPVINCGAERGVVAVDALITGRRLACNGVSETHR
ncbi:MAG TPA: acetate--CoA ligase family protein [Ktedonobacteraceae bacterium]|nr:acetate--CoA ligase family protein [Ktedonobacteraceae bacterium]